VDLHSLVSRLEHEWDYDLGFFGPLRRGSFDRSSLESLLEILEAAAVEQSESINRRLVSLLWYMPLFMQWQRDRVKELGGDLAEFDAATNHVQSIVERLLGVP